jgi:hypothetical protein
MGDMGDYWRDVRDWKRNVRRSWHECPNCDFGGNPPKVAPGCTCRHCGWEAPGERGDDIRNANAIEQPEPRTTCRECGREFADANSCFQHERDKHGRKVKS